MIDPDNLQPGPEPLHKVLPAGVPLQSRGWTCPSCGITRPDGQPQRCNSFNCLRDICPVMGSHT